MHLPCSLDFVADVELAAKAVLSPEHYKFFLRFFLDQDWDNAVRLLNEEDRVNLERTKSKIQVVLGREFKARSLHPVNLYMHAQSNSLGKKRCKCIDGAHEQAAGDSDLWCVGGCRLNMAYHTPAHWVVTSSKIRLWCEDCNQKRLLEEATEAE